MKTSRSVLLIEDDKDDQEFFIEALSEIQNVMLFAVANNGKEALSKLNSSFILPDIIFSDINMPLMNGIECLSEIKKNVRFLHIPVVFLSSDTGKTETVCKLGANGFLTKSYDGKTFHYLLEKFISWDFMINDYVNLILQPQPSAR